VCELRDIDNGDVLSIYSKGWHDPTEFAKIAKYEFEIDIDISKVRTIYLRWEMFNGPDGVCQIAQVHAYPGKGIFPVTIVDYIPEEHQNDPK
jgi:hypothetical protein